MILDDLNNFNDYKEMNIHEQKEFLESLLSGSDASLNGYDITDDKNTMAYTRTCLYNNSTYHLSIEETVVNM